MRNTARIIVVTAMALGAVGLAALPGGAGGHPTNTVIVEKEVTGDVPAGTTFTVEVTCENQFGPDAATVEPVEMVFSATGAPMSENLVTTSAGTVCTATETVNGGATSTTYECDMVRGPTDDIGPPFLGNCTGDNEATFGDVIGDTATITVTNTFPTAPPRQPITPVAQAVQAAPVFTG